MENLSWRLHITANAIEFLREHDTVGNQKFCGMADSMVWRKSLQPNSTFICKLFSNLYLQFRLSFSSPELNISHFILHICLSYLKVICLNLCTISTPHLLPIYFLSVESRIALNRTMGKFFDFSQSLPASFLV